MLHATDISLWIRFAAGEIEFYLTVNKRYLSLNGMLALPGTRVALVTVQGNRFCKAIGFTPSQAVFL
jgi:hypothetical protein